MVSEGNWHGKNVCFGMHYDLHANSNDTELGADCAPDTLVPILKKIRVDFVQTDCKGHPGMTSWLTSVPDGTRSPGIVKDALSQWRDATERLHLPLHCHYSGIFDMAAAKKHPDWCVVPAEGAEPDVASGKMCPRSPYLETLMIPQLLELIDRYHVDGFWIDGDIWAVKPCYCPRCLAEFKKRTGRADVPANPSSPDWTQWMRFQLDSFNEYVTAYTEAVHRHHPHVLVCSNWSQTLRNPGRPACPTDWISGDNSWIWGLDDSRCEARWLCNRNKPWDIMLWAKSKSREMSDITSPWHMKPPQMLQQEAAVLLATGGHVQIYESGYIRSGRLIPWHMKRIRQVADFIKKRLPLCQDTQTFPMVAVLHSECHYYSSCGSDNILWGFDHSHVSGATWCISDCHLGVDILDEYRLKERMDDFPVIVVPEQHNLSDDMVQRLKDYVADGGRLLLTGARLAERFGFDFIGIQSMETAERATFHLPVGHEETFPLYSAVWGKITPSRGTRSLGKLGKTPLRHERLTDYSCATLKRKGDGRILFVPADIFHDYAVNRDPQTCQFVHELLKRLDPDSPVVVDAPTAVDFIARSGKRGLFFHFINKSSGLPNSPRQGMVDEIPPVGPIRITLYLGMKPQSVRWLFEDEEQLSWTWTPTAIPHQSEPPDHHHHDDGDGCCCCHIEDGESGTLTVTIRHLAIHGALNVCL